MRVCFRTRSPWRPPCGGVPYVPVSAEPINRIARTAAGVWGVGVLTASTAASVLGWRPDRKHGKRATHWLPLVSGPALAMDKMPAPVCLTGRGVDQGPG
jgi:hypothetical protein